MQAKGRPNSKKSINKSGQYKKQYWKPRTNSATPNTIEDDIKSIRSVIGDNFTEEYIKMTLISVDGRVEIAIDYLLNELEKSDIKVKSSVVSPKQVPIIAQTASTRVETASNGKPICIVLNDNKEYINTRFVKVEEEYEHIWVNLPTEIVQEILSYCDLVDAGILMQVCKSWKQIITWSSGFWNTMWCVFSLFMSNLLRKVYLEPRYQESSRAKSFFKNDYQFVRALVQRQKKCSKCQKQFYDYDNEWLGGCTANPLKIPVPHVASGCYILYPMEVRCRRPSKAFRLLREFMKNEVEVPHTVDASTKWHGTDKDIFFKDSNTEVEISDSVDILNYLIGMYAFKTSSIAILSKWEELQRH